MHTDPPRSLSPLRLLFLLLGSTAAWHLAFAAPQMAGWFVMAHAALLVQLRRAKSGRAAFYAGLIAGLGVMVAPLWFFWPLFGRLAVALWLLLALWPALFVCALHGVEKRWGRCWMLGLAPVLWAGLEFCRCEVWPLKFSWLSLAFPLPADLWARGFHTLGIYGLGALIIGIAVWADRKLRWFALLAVPLLAWPLGLLRRDVAGPDSLRVTGIQWEQVGEERLLESLDKALAAWPDTFVFVLSEYSLQGPPPAAFTAWCRTHRTHLILGGTEDVPGGKPGDYYNTAFVIGPDGEIVHRQVKSVPIQFFADGLPATEQRVWDAERGRFGLAICYDMNYTRVMDGLVDPSRDPAGYLIIPAMDLKSWGLRAHELSAHLGAVRAAEYGVPLFRLASSGISRASGPTGVTLAVAPFPGQGEMLSALLPRGTAALPWDRWIVWPCLAVTAGVILFLTVIGFRRGRRRQGDG